MQIKTDQPRIDTLEPDFAKKIQAFKLVLLQATGYDWYVAQARRTIAEQDALYAQGRTAPGKVVTNAKGGSSPHNFGLAADMVPVSDGDLWWNCPKSLLQQAADLAIKNGLVPGFYFHSIYDPDHFEDPHWKDQQALWKAGKLKVT